MEINKFESSSLLFNYLQADVPAKHSNAGRVAQISIQFFAITLALCARIPAIPISRKAGGDVQAYGWTLAIVNIISYGSLISWSFIKAIEERGRAKSPIEKQISEKNSVQMHVALLATAIFIGVFSQIPFGYMAYKYNDASWLMAGIILVGDAPLPIYSLLLSFQKGKQTKLDSALKNKCKDNFILKYKLISIIDHYKENFPLQYSAKFSVRDSSPLLRRDIQNPSNKSEYPLWIKATRVFMGSVGYIATVGRLGMFAALAYEGASLLSGGQEQRPNGLAGEIFSSSLALLVVVANAYLLKKVIVNASVNNIQRGLDLIRRRYKPSLSDVMYPKLSGVLHLLSLGLVSLSYSTPYQVSKDAFAHSSFHGITVPGLQLFIEITSTYAVLALVFNSLHFFIEGALEKIAMVKNEEKQKKFIYFSEKLSRISDYLRQSPIEEVEEFLSAIRSADVKEEDTSLNAEFIKYIKRDSSLFLPLSGSDVVSI